MSFATTAVLLWVVWRSRHQPRTRFVAIVVPVLIVALTWFPFGIRLWRLWYYAVPVLSATRAVARIGMLLTIPGANLGSHRRGARRSIRAGIIAIALIFGFEQMRGLPG